MGNLADCQSLSLWERWHRVSDDGEGKAAAVAAGPQFSRCSRWGEGKPASENSAPLFPTAYDKAVSPISRFLTGCICYTLPKGGGAYPHGDLSRRAAFGKFRYHSVVFVGGRAAERRHSKRMAGHGRGGAGGGGLPHPAGPDGSMAAGAGVPDSHRGSHRPRCLRLAGGAVLSAAGGMVHGSPPRADGGGAPARRPQQQFQRLSAPFAGAAAPLRRGRVSGRAGRAAAAGEARRADSPRYPARGRGRAAAPGLLRHRLLGAGAAFGPGRGAGAVCRRPKCPAAPAGGLLIRLLFRRYRPASAGACAAVRPLHHRRGPLHPARRPRRPRVSPARPLYAAFCDLPPPPGGWEMLAGEEALLD